MKILFVGEFEYNCGSTHAVYNYKLQADKAGHRIFLQGAKDAFVANLFDEISLSKADCVIFVVEDRLFIDERYLKHIQDQVPKERRIVIDADGR